MTITLLEAARGVEKEIEVPRSETCPKCGGKGQVLFTQGFLSVSRPCGQCQGRGQIIGSPCPECNGQTRIRSMRTMKVAVPAGAENGLRLRLTGEGELGLHGGPPGDLYVEIEVEEHAIFSRDGDDLLCELPISFPQAALGSEVEVPTLDGKVRLKIPAGTQNGKIFRLRGKGIVSLRGYGKGDILIRVTVEVPTKLNKRQKELIQELAELSGDSSGPLAKSFLDKVKDVFGS